jgi:hypothetical protein
LIRTQIAAGILFKEGLKNCYHCNFLYIKSEVNHKQFLGSCQDLLDSIE